MIESYSFGRMVIDGRKYSSDLIIYPDGHIQDSWWRKEGHMLQLADLAEVINAQPGIIVAGSGSPGLMKPAPGLAASLNNQGITFMIQPTAEAYQTFNRLVQDQQIAAGCFHLTC